MLKGNGIEYFVSCKGRDKNQSEVLEQPINVKIFAYTLIPIPIDGISTKAEDDISFHPIRCPYCGYETETGYQCIASALRESGDTSPGICPFGIKLPKAVDELLKPKQQ